MKLGVSWRVKGVWPEARESAEEAARRSGVSLGDWLNAAIAQQAQHWQAPSPPIPDRAFHGGNFTAPQQPRNEPARRIEHLAYAGLAAYAPKHSRSALDQPAPLPPDMPSVRLPPSLDLAVAEIAERQRTLNGGTAAPRWQPPAATPSPSQNLAGLEEQLRSINKQIETLRKPGVEQAINALREELAEIGRSIRDALPRRALEAIETQIHNLDRRIVESRQAGIDASALRSIEQGLAEIRDATRGLMPAENLVGYTDAIANLARKIELIVAHNDPATMNQLEHSITTLREMSNHIASNETVRALATQVQELSEKIDTVARAGSARNDGAFSSLEQRIATLSDAITERNRASAAASPRLEALLQALADKIDRLQLASAPHDASPQIKALFETLADKIDRIQLPSAMHDASPQIKALFATLADKIDHIQLPNTADDASPQIEAHLQELADKIDRLQIPSEPQDVSPQLEALLEALADKIDRLQLPSAPAETSSQIEAHLEALYDKIDHLQLPSAPVEATSQIEAHLEALYDKIDHLQAEVVHDDGATSQRFEALLEALADKIDHIQLHGAQSAGDAIAHLEDRIVSLVEKLDASDARLGHLEGIERGVADLLLHIEDLRADSAAVGLRANALPGVDDLRHDIARTYDALEVIHDRLGHVVGRLATIETNIHDQAHPIAAPDSAAAPMAPAAHLDDTAATIAAPPSPEPQYMPPDAGAPGEPEFEDNEPLEPGSGPPHLQANPGARIAASDAALGGAAPAAAPSGKSSFIAAARRAAQAASQQGDPRAKRPDAAAAAGKKASLTAKVIKRVKSLFVAASIIAIVVGSVEIAANKFDFGNPLTKLATAPLTVPAQESEQAEAAAQPATPDATASIAAQPAPPSEPPAAGSLATAPANGAVATAPVLSPLQSMTPSLFGPPVFPPNGDITGSIPPPPPITAIAPPVAPSPEPQAADNLPAAIGSAKLRNAAAAGDATAAYAVAQRYAEGRGVPINMEEAAHWYERAAAKGLAPAQFRYASLLEKGVGVKKDLAQARNFYMAAAKKGNSKAMHNLAVLYAEGVDGKPDYATAAQWFRKAAEHGIADSQYNLGVLYARGLGIAKSFSEAYKWFALAATQGDSEAAKKRDEIAPQLDAKAIAAAQQAIKSFVALPQPQDAVNVREPAGGWDHAAAAAHPAAQSPSPLALGDFQKGPR